MIFKTFSYYFERFGGPILFIMISSLLFFLVKPKYENFKEIINEFPPIGLGIFGFLLTLLGIIIQGSGPTIEWMKSRTQLYARLIKLNKFVVWLSLFLSIYSYLLRLFESFEIQLHKNFLENIFISFFVGATVWLLKDTIYFINVFYLLITDKNDK